MLVITRQGLSTDAQAYVDEQAGLRHQTIWELENEILGLTDYVRSLTGLFHQDGLSDYYIPGRARLARYESDHRTLSETDTLLFEAVTTWIDGEDYQPIAILGGYGAGKSSFIKRLVANQAERALSDPYARRPILIGLGEYAQRARNDAEEAAQTRSGSEATAGLDGLRFHDLRGTAATNYILAGLPLDDVATILGWELQRVKEIARRYVTGEAIGLGMIARLQEGQNRRPTVKPSVKPTSLRRGQKGSNAVRAVAGELGLEPRMTVPKTVVLPLHHSPAGPAFPQRSVRRRRSDRPNRFGMQHPLSGLFSVCAKRVEMGACGLSNPWL